MSSQNPVTPASGNDTKDRVEARVDVVAGRYYAFAVTVDDPEAPSDASTIAQLRFLNEAGQQLRGPYAGASNSDKLGPYVSMAHGPDDGRVWSRSIVRAPEGARQVLVRARKWKGSPEFSFSALPQCVEEIDAARDIRELQVTGGETFRLRLSLRDTVEASDAAVVQVVFVDREGVPIAGDYAGLTHSSRFPNYFYAAASDTGADTDVELLAPTDACAIRVHVHAWKAGKGLALHGEPRLLSALPDGLDASAWLAVVQDVTVSLSVEDVRFDTRGKPLVLRMRTFSDRPSDEPVGHFFVEYPGSREPASGPFALSGTDGSPRETSHVVVTPADAAGVAVRFHCKEQKLLAVSRRISARALDISRGPHAKTISGGTRFELRSGASEAWHAVLEIQLIRVANGATGTPELGFFFGDSRKKTLSTASILAGEYESVRTAGSVLYVKPRRAAAGIEGTEVFSLSLRILPPPGTQEMIARIDPKAPGSTAAMQWTCEPFTKLVEQALQPALAEQLSGLESQSRDAALAVLDELMQRYPTDVAVLSAGIDTCRRLGDVGRLRLLNARAAGLTGPSHARLRLKARLSAATLEELEPDYLPVPGRVASTGSRAAAGEGGRALRVAHLFKTTVPYENTGGAIRCKNIVRHQKRLGMEPVVITPLGYPHAGGDGGAWETELVDDVLYYRLNPVSREALRDVPVTKQLDFTALLVTRILQEDPVDIVQASSGYRGYEQALVGLSVARALDIPFVYEVRSYHEHCWRGMTDWILDAELTRARFVQEDRCMREADAVVTICETMKAGLIERGIAPEKIFVVPNSVDVDAFRPKPLDPGFKRSLGLTQPVTVGYISNVSKREGHHVLLHAVAEARDRGCAIDCLIVGGGRELDQLRELSADLGIFEYVVFTGEVPHDDVARYYNAIDIFVIPRVADFASDFVTPMKPFEAMAMNRCVLISDRPALQEIVEPGVRGGMFRAGDHHDLAKRLIEFSRDSALRDRYAEQGRLWVEQERTWDKTIQVYEEVYEFANSQFRTGWN